MNYCEVWCGVQRKHQSLTFKVGIEFAVTWNSVFQVFRYDEQDKAQFMTTTFVKWYLWRILMLCRKKLVTWQFLSAKYKILYSNSKGRRLFQGYSLNCSKISKYVEGEFHGKIVRTVGIFLGQSNFLTITPSEWRLGKKFKHFF